MKKVSTSVWAGMLIVCAGISHPSFAVESVYPDFVAKFNSIIQNVKAEDVLSNVSECGEVDAKFLVQPSQEDVANLLNKPCLQAISARYKITPISASFGGSAPADDNSMTTLALELIIAIPSSTSADRASRDITYSINQIRGGKLFGYPVEIVRNAPTSK